MLTQIFIYKRLEVIPFNELKVIGFERTEKEDVELKFIGEKNRMKGIFARKDADAIVALATKRNKNIYISETPERKRFRLHLIRR